MIPEGNIISVKASAAGAKGAGGARDSEPFGRGFREQSSLKKFLASIEHLDCRKKRFECG